MELTAAAAGAGADAVLAWPPPGSEDLAGDYAAVGQAAGGLPVLGYHIPWVSAPGIPVSALHGLPVAGLKDSSGNPARLLAEVAHYPGRTYVGSSALLALAGPLGGTGAILAIANVEPELCSRGVRRGRRGPAQAHRHAPRRARRRAARAEADPRAAARQQPAQPHGRGRGPRLRPRLLARRRRYSSSSRMRTRSSGRLLGIMWLVAISR